MKNEELYPEYLTYLDNRLLESKITKGEYPLLKMSRMSFDKFINRFENDNWFRGSVLELHKSETRDKKIDDIFNDIDF
jgi:hypothetical protein